MSRPVIRDVAGLVAAGLVPQGEGAALAAVGDRYAVAVTPAMAELMVPGDRDDPIARQFLPDRRELDIRAEEDADPIGDHAHSPVPGLVHRYPDRVLLKVVHVCPVYCRFCFRRDMVGPDGDGMLGDADLASALAYVAEHPAIWEVILTGGDPLMLSPRRLAAILDGLGRIGHVGIVRIHSRVPVAEPGRISMDLLAVLRDSAKPVVLAVHANHPRELTGPACEAIAGLGLSGVMLVSQTVLLKGVNDDASVLAALMRRFVENRIKPYYLHHPDLAPGTAHFRLSIEAGRRIVAELERQVSGLCRPTYVLDVPGGHGKVGLMPSPVTGEAAAGYVIVDRSGALRTYRDID